MFPKQQTSLQSEHKYEFMIMLSVSETQTHTRDRIDGVITDN